LPVLQRLGIPALIFVVCDGLAAGDPFPHFVFELQASWPRMRALANHPGLAKVLAATSHKSLEELFKGGADSVCDIFARALGADELADLSADLAAAGMPRRTMDRGQLQRAARSELIDLGAHSMTHRPLTVLPSEEVESEIRESTQMIAGMTGRAPSDVAFAYPFGFVSAQAASVVGRFCRSGFTCAARPVSGLDRSATLPRFNLDRSAPRRTAEARPLESAIAALRETALLYVRTDLGRRVSAPLRHAVRALRGR
jgi:peptidoglycan/xylan/chitin deacetylase (PgdA/CDA1 family)